jgi:transcription-repair coupling factor (superfamily II helicase)
LEKNTLKVSVEDKISIDFINEVLFEYEFKRVDFITEPGEFSVRGGIVDVFSFRMIIHTELSFGDEVESIRSFDVATQLSLEKQKKITIIPNVENKVFRKRKFLDYISEKTVLFIKIQKIYFRSWISSSTEQKKLLKNCQGHQTCLARSIILNQKTF